jgi:hypothetical protein
MSCDTGKSSHSVEALDKKYVLETAPNWDKENLLMVYDGIAMLKQGTHPVGPMLSHLQNAEPGKHVVLKTDFPPAPLIKRLIDEGNEGFLVLPVEEGEPFQSWFRKR